MKAVVLVGGYGTRLRPLTAGVPKQMLPVIDRPMIEHVVTHLAANGVTQVVLSMGFRPEAFLAAYPDGICAGLPIRYAIEPEPLGTAGAVRFTVGQNNLDQTFLVLNGDVLTDLDVTAMLERHRSIGASATIALTQVADPSRFGVVKFDDDRRVNSFVEKPPAAEDRSGWINAGIYVLEPEVIERISGGHNVSIEREVFPTMAKDGVLWAEPFEGYWLDTGTPETYLQANLDLIDGTRGRCIPVDPDSRTSPDARIENSVLMRRSVVGRGALVCDALVMEGASIGADALVRGSIIGPNAVIGDGASVLDGCVIGPGSVLSSGALLSSERFPKEV